MHELEIMHKKIDFNVLHVTQPSDHGILTQLMFFGSTHNVELKIYPDAKFIDSIDGFSEWSRTRNLWCKSIIIDGLEKNITY